MIESTSATSEIFDSAVFEEEEEEEEEEEVVILFQYIAMWLSWKIFLIMLMLVLVLLLSLSLTLSSSLLLLSSPSSVLTWSDSKVRPTVYGFSLLEFKSSKRIETSRTWTWTVSITLLIRDSPSQRRIHEGEEEEEVESAELLLEEEKDFLT